MYKKKKILLIIPARKGSIGLKNKNLLKIGGKSLVEWSMEAAKKVKKIDKILVTTDSKKIMKLAINKGLNCPFLRPGKLSTNTAKPSDVIVHSLKYLKKQKENFDFFVYLEPTSPFTTSKDIDNSIKFFLRKYKSKDSLVSISKFEKIHDTNILKINNKKFVPILKKYQNDVRRQDKSILAYLDGSIYISKVNKFFLNRGFLNKKTEFIFFDQWKSIEIDNKIDFIVAKSIYLKYKKILLDQNKIIK